MLESLTRLTNVTTVNVSKEERWLSLAIGSILMLYAAIRIPLSAVLAAVAAAYLFFRGLRGFCYIYEGLQMNKAIHNHTSNGEAQGQSRGNAYRPMTYSSTERPERSLS